MTLQVLLLSGNRQKTTKAATLAELSSSSSSAIRCNWTGSIKVTERCFTPCLLCCPYVVIVKINTQLLIHHSSLVHTVSGQANWPHLTIILSCVMSNTRDAWQRMLAGSLKNDPCKPWSAEH